MAAPEEGREAEGTSHMADKMQDGMELDNLWIETHDGGFAPASEHLMAEQEED